MDTIVLYVIGFFLLLFVLPIFLIFFPSVLKAIFYWFVYLFTGEKGTFRERKNKAAALHHKQEFEKKGFKSDKILYSDFPHEYVPTNHQDRAIISKCFHCLIIDKDKKVIQLGRLDNVGMFSRFPLSEVFRIEEGMIIVHDNEHHDLIYKGFYLSFLLKSGEIDRIWLGINQNAFDEVSLFIQLLLPKSA
jgi:hypothetical protein